MRNLQRAYTRSQHVGKLRMERVVKAHRANDGLYDDREYWLYARANRRIDLLKYELGITTTTPKQICEIWDTNCRRWTVSQSAEDPRRPLQPLMRIEVTV